MNPHSAWIGSMVKRRITGSNVHFETDDQIGKQYDNVDRIMAVKETVVQHLLAPTSK